MRSVTALLVVAAVALACGGGAPRPTRAPTPPPPTPVASLTPALSATVAALERHLRGGGFALAPYVAPYRPAVTPSLATAPRTVYRVTLADPGIGQLVVFELPDAAIAAREAQALATYLGGNFGQTTYPRDAQFAVSQLGPTVVFAYHSENRARGAEDARRAFQLLTTFGQPVPVVK